MRYATIILILLFLGSCRHQSPIGKEFTVLDKTEVCLDTVLDSHAATALFFLSPECPLCQNYTVTIDRIQKDFSEKNVAFYGVVSGEYYSNADTKGFLIRYKLDLPIILDPEMSLANYYQAEITPEALLIGKNSKAMYKGAIDNWAISLGQKRPKVTEHYFDDALSAYLEGETINPDKTKAIGCFIE